MLVLNIINGYNPVWEITNITILKQGISDTHKKITNFNKDLENNEKHLRENIRWMKFILIKHSVHRLLVKQENCWKRWEKVYQVIC